jgi:hypothetical protein
MQEVMDRLNTKKPDAATIAPVSNMPQTCSLIQNHPPQELANAKAESFAAVREGGRLLSFPGQAGIPVH